MQALATERWQETGPPLCITRCMRASFCLVDGDPYCVECADALLAGEQSPSLTATLAAEERGGWLPPLRGPVVPSGDHPKLRERRRQWAALQHRTLHASCRTGPDESGVYPCTPTSLPNGDVTCGACGIVRNAARLESLPSDREKVS